MRLMEASTRISLEHILFATDFSPGSDAALPYAVSIARRYNSKIYLVNVIAPESPEFVPPVALYSTHELADQYAQEQLERISVRLHGIPHYVVLRHGDVWEVLSEIIQKNDMDLLVMGTHGRSGFRKMLMGSLAEEVFRQAPCPVLTIGPKVCVQPRSTVELGNILYATDFSHESRTAAAYALSLAQEHEAHLTLLHVIENLDGNGSSKPEKAAEALHRLKTLVPAESELWCSPEFVVECGAPVDRILEAADKQQADLIVLGARRASGSFPIEAHLPTGTAQKVVSQSKRPVLTVRH